MTKHDLLIGLNLVNSIGPVRLKALQDSFVSPEEIFTASAQRLMRVQGVGEEIAAGIRAVTPQRIAREIEEAGKQGITIITTEDALYPAPLRDIYAPPAVLYVKGDPGCLGEPAVAMVGSRRASLYGLTSAEKFAEALSRYGLVIVSGMARGVDTRAHRGALKAGGRTVAVIGSGFKQLYPPENRDLADAIAATGAVVTEFPLDTPPRRQNFPRRNRLISALSCGVFVVEAARNSGALITADFALEQGKEVFALPGRVDAVTSTGTNALIRQGAGCVVEAEDIIGALPLWALGVRAVPGAAAPEIAEQSAREAVEDVITEEKRSGLSEEEGVVAALFGEQPVALDELVERSGLDISRVSAILLRLRMKRFIHQLPGQSYQRP